MNANYTVIAVDGKAYKWSFFESKNEGDYGNGIYIGVKAPSGDTFSLDCRYVTNYNFTKTCVECLLNYYGENLDELYEDDPQTRLTFKTVKGKHLVTVNGVEKEYSSLSEALKAVFDLKVNK